MIFWCLDSIKSSFTRINDEIDDLSWNFNVLSSIKPENQRFLAFRSQWSIDQKRFTKHSCQNITCELKMILHLVKSKIYSKCHQQHPRGTSNSQSQACWNNLAQDPLHPSHGLNQAPWTNLTVYPQACLMTTWIANSALNSHWSPNSKWLLNPMTQPVKANFICPTINKPPSPSSLMWTNR